MGTTDLERRVTDLEAELADIHGLVDALKPMLMEGKALMASIERKLGSDYGMPSVRFKKPERVN